MAGKKAEKVIIKPLAAAFLTKAPEENTEVKEMPVKSRASKPEKAANERTKAMLKEQLLPAAEEEKNGVRAKAKTAAPAADKKEKAVKAAVSKPAPKEVKKETPKKETAKKESAKKPADKKAPAVKETAKKDKKDVPGKESAKKAGVKAVSAKTVSKKTDKSVKDTAKKETAPVKSPKDEPGTEVIVEYAGRSYVKEELIEKAYTVWSKKLKRGRKDLKEMELYFKPEEQTIYYVFNQTRKGSFKI